MEKASKMNGLGAVVKSARLARRLTREQLASALGITPRHLSAIENENQKPSYDLLYHLIRELAIPADTIFYPELGYERAETDRLRLLLAGCNEKEVSAVTLTLQSLLDSGNNHS
jgi:transcriptional regulator with XRE-family HTH domain